MITLRSISPIYLILSCTLLLVLQGRAEGVVSNCTEADLRAALSGGGTVSFACSGTIVLSNTLNITTNTLIDATGHYVTISGGNVVRLVLVTSNVDLRIQGLSLVDGAVVGTHGLDGITPTAGGDAFGAGILNQGGILRLISCNLSNNVAMAGAAGNSDPSSGFTGSGAGGAAFGGAICNFGGKLFLTNCVLAINHALGGLGTYGSPVYGGSGPGGPASGGAIYSENGVLFLQGSKLQANSASGASNYYGSCGRAVGGAIDLRHSTLSLSNCLLLNNRVTGGDCGDLMGGPGGDALGGALFIPANASVTLWSCVLSANSAKGGRGSVHIGGLGLGGSVYAEGPLEISDSSFCSNSVVTGTGLDPVSNGPFSTYGSPGRGGAIWSSNSVVINRCTFWTNCAFGGNNGSYHSYQTGGPGEGGAIWSSGTLRATNSTFFGNRTAGGRGTFGIPTDGGGGGFGGGLCLTRGESTLVNVTFASNAVNGVRLDDLPYPIPPVDYYSPARGSSLYATNAAAVTVLNSIFANSTNAIGPNYQGQSIPIDGVWGPVTDKGHNLCSDDTAKFSAPGSQNNIDPRLGALTANGGPTATMALLSASPGRDAIPSGFPPVDQRGILRPQGSAADIGAVEGDPLAIRQPELTAISSGSDLSLWLIAEPFLSYRVLASTNLVTWLPAATNSISYAGPLQFTVSTAAAPRFFFRIVTP